MHGLAFFWGGVCVGVGVRLASEGIAAGPAATIDFSGK